MPELQAIAQLFPSAKVAIPDLLSFLAGNPITIQVDPLTQQLAGKNVTASLVANGIELQLH